MKSSVIIFPGSNCDRDMDVALKKFGFKNQMVWHNDFELPKSDLIVLPGGFSYGDYLRCGSIAGKSKIINVKNLETKRDFIYIKDLVDAIIKAINLEKNFEILNIGSGVSYSVTEVIKIIQKISLPHRHMIH